MRGRDRKLLALLAAGVVLLGGGITTLAAWQDTEYVQLPLSLTTLSIETSPDGTNWNRTDTTGTAASLVLSVNGLLNGGLTPNGAVTSWVGLRAATNSLGATVAMTNVSLGTGTGDKGILSLTQTGGQPALTYEAVAGVDKAACQANTFTGGSSIVPSGSALSVSSSSFTIPAATSSAPGAAVGVCFRLRLADNIARSYGGAQITPLWTFNATSTGG